MNEEIKAHVAKYCASKGWPTDDETIIDVIREAKSVWSGLVSTRRWWRDVFCVVEIDGMLIGFMGAQADGDGPEDRGWEFDPSTICKVKSKEVTMTIYEKDAA